MSLPSLPLVPALLWRAALVAGALSAGAATAGPVIPCTSPGVPVGCVSRQAVRTATPGAGAPGVGVAPGVGAGAPGVGVRPGAGPVAGPNAGGPVNRVGAR